MREALEKFNRNKFDMVEDIRDSKFWTSKLKLQIAENPIENSMDRERFVGTSLICDLPSFF